MPDPNDGVDGMLLPKLGKCVDDPNDGGGFGPEAEADPKTFVGGV